MHVLELELLIQMMNITSGLHHEQMSCGAYLKEHSQKGDHGQFNEHVVKPGTLYM